MPENVRPSALPDSSHDGSWIFLPPLPEREVLPAAEAAEVAEVVLPIIIQAAAGDKADGRVRFRRFCLREPL